MYEIALDILFKLLSLDGGKGNLNVKIGEMSIHNYISGIDGFYI